MKCPICDGVGTSNTCVNGTFKPCSFCDGTGEVQVTEPKLKPCPFCGREPVYVPNGKVICNCGAMMQSFNEWKPFPEQDAVNRWNKRVVAE